MKRTLLALSAWVALGWSLGLVAPSGAVASDSLMDVKVEQRTYEVQLSDGHLYKVVGFLYYQGSVKNRPLQILTHGITYNHDYWDLPEVNHQDYSYARYMARQQYAVLALDLPGTGLSDHPNGDFYTLAESVSTLHQVAQQVKDPKAREHFDTVVFVGHSNGSLISTYAQALYRDAKAVVFTGWLNTPHTVPVDASTIGPVLQQGPAVRVPAELRTGLFYATGYADPAVIALDNQQADVISRGQLVDLLTLLADPSPIPNKLIDVPVMVQLGENEVLAPASAASLEAKA